MNMKSSLSKRLKIRRNQGKDVLKGTLHLLLGNCQKLDTAGTQRLEAPMQANHTLATVYTLKEQLQALRTASTETAMRNALDQCC